MLYLGLNIWLSEESMLRGHVSRLGWASRVGQRSDNMEKEVLCRGPILCRSLIGWHLQTHTSVA